MALPSNFDSYPSIKQFPPLSEENRLPDNEAFPGVAFVYCTQHLSAHATGWCTVSNMCKIPLEAKTIEEAFRECEAKGYHLFKG